MKNWKKKHDLLYVTTAIKNLTPGAEFTSNLDNNTIIEWLSPDITQPSQAEIDSEMTRLEAIFNAEEYSRNRSVEYPSIEELTIALYDTDDKAALVTKRAAVKTKWPKDNSGPIE